MDVIGKGFNHPHGLLPPGYCYLCRSTPDLSVGYVVDTHCRVHLPNTMYDDAGRVYICEGCANSIAGAIGYRSDLVADQLSEINELSEIIQELSDTLRTVDHIVALCREIPDASDFEVATPKKEGTATDIEHPTWGLSTTANDPATEDSAIGGSDVVVGNDDTPVDEPVKKGRGRTKVRKLSEVVGGN